RSDLNEFKNSYFDVIYHLAALQPMKGKTWYDFYETNSMATMKIHSLIKTGLFIYVSTASIYGNTENIINEKTTP
ncbi:MAG TPA: NAD-dependent epimerase/dehydratase family protein, partial [Victivallales bacterium]|nr:NAD-dependent epimerase/dehydratase family protein [Victivallales bacterium]